MLKKSNTSIINTALIRGYIKIKRKRFWVNRYAELHSTILFYYEKYGIYLLKKKLTFVIIFYK